MLEVVGLLKDKNETVVGYKISSKGSYTVAVTKSKAEDLKVPDLDLVQYFDLPYEEVVLIGKDKYALVDNASSYFEEYSGVARDYFGDKVLYYGYLFDDRYIISLDSDYAIKRMVAESNNSSIFG